MTCPNLKHLDLRKITPEMREAGGGGGKINGGSGGAAAVANNNSGKLLKIEDSSHKGESNIGNMSTDISPDKQNA